MGILRKLIQWREKSDGTLEGPALSTESVDSEEYLLDGEPFEGGGDSNWTLEDGALVPATDDGSISVEHIVNKFPNDGQYIQEPITTIHFEGDPNDEEVDEEIDVSEYDGVYIEGAFHAGTSSNLYIRLDGDDSDVYNYYNYQTDEETEEDDSFYISRVTSRGGQIHCRISFGREIFSTLEHTQYLAWGRGSDTTPPEIITGNTRDIDDPSTINLYSSSRMSIDIVVFGLKRVTE